MQLRRCQHLGAARSWLCCSRPYCSDGGGHATTKQWQQARQVRRQAGAAHHLPVHETGRHPDCSCCRRRRRLASDPCASLPWVPRLPLRLALRLPSSALGLHADECLRPLYESFVAEPASNSATGNQSASAVLPPRNTGLQRLQLPCFGMTDDELAAGIRHLPSLRRLDLVSCHGMRSRALVALRHCSRLRHLALEHGSEIQFGRLDRRILWPLRHAGSLATLWVTHWPRANPRDVSDLQAAFSAMHGRQLDVVLREQR